MDDTNRKTSNYQTIIARLDQFIRKYYKNLIIRGVILVLSFLLLSYLAVSIPEFFGHFNIAVRTFLYYLYLFINIFIIYYYIIIPLLKLYRIGSIISHKQAALIIGTHFGEVKDKLINTLQLGEMMENEDSSFSIDLIRASIEQKTGQLRPVPFLNAVNFVKNKKYLKYFLIPLAIIFLILIFSPKILTESTKRLVRHGTYFEREMPFHFILMNDNLKAVRNSDFEIHLKIEGKAIPEEVYISASGNEYLMSRVHNNIYSYVFKNLRNDINFSFYANEYHSRSYELMVLAKPVLVKFQVRLDYPAYIKKESSIVDNIGDLTIPAGTIVRWKFFTEDADRLTLTLLDTVCQLRKTGRNIFEYNRRFLKNNSYSVNASNSYLVNPDSVRYYVNIIPDAYPRIKVKQEADTISRKLLFFTGEISDDYGFKRFTFNYKYTESKDTAKLKKVQVSELNFDASKNYELFYHSWDLNNIDVQPGDAIEYFFEIWDNDEINGSKSTLSDKFYFRAPTLDEVDKQSEKLSTDLKNDLYNAERHVHDIQSDIQKARKDMLDNKDLKWEDKKFMENIIDKNEKLKDELKDIKKKYIENAMTHDDSKNIDDELLKKYDQLYKMFDQLIPDDLKALYKQLEDMLQKNMKDMIPENMDKLDMNNKELSKELDRMLEQFKQLELSQKAKSIEDKLNDLSKRQNDLSNKTDDKNPDKNNIKNDQQQLNKEFDGVKKDIDDLNKLNKQIENPIKLDDLNPDQKEIEQQMNQSLDKLDNNQMKNASKNQRKASEKMKELSDKIDSMMMEGEMKTIDIDYEKLRRILDNVLHVSFDQEDLMNSFANVNSYNPQYVELAQKQSRLKEYSKMIEDSLFTLSKQLPMISSVINKEIGDINFNYEQLNRMLALRDISNARVKQQYILTSTNNLGLLLSEVLNQLQQESQNMKGKMKAGMKGNSKKMKKSGGQISDMKQLQDELNKKISQMKNGQLQQNNNSEIAKIAMQQQMIRNALRKIADQQNKQGNDKMLEQLNEIQKMMEKTEEDLVNKRITPEMEERQKQITVKLLEAEKAEMKQDYEEKRQSKTAREIFNPNPPTLEQYKRMKLKEIELLQTVPPSLSGYYRMKVKEYFNEIK